MNLGSILRKNFSQQTKGKNLGANAGEIDLFRALISAFVTLPNYAVCEIHGNKHLVSYTETQNWYYKEPKCELGDIIILAFSKEKKSGRLIVIQNKVSRNSSGQLGSDCRGVLANLVQYELLSTRPDFWYVKDAGKTPNSLINSLSHPSVCQYGLFYRNSNGDIDMSSITASRFHFSLSVKARFPLHSKHPCARICFGGGFESFASCRKEDFVAADNLVDFGDLLEDLYIGKPICNGDKPAILSLFSKVDTRLYTSAMRKVIDDFRVTEFTEAYDMGNLAGDNGRTHEVPENLLDYCRTLLVINVDACDSNEGYN